jgi:predicted nucleic acid-binding protein
MENNPFLSTVVSDSGPLIHLAQVNKLEILQKLFGCIIVSPSVRVEVVDEGMKRSCPDAEIVGRAFEDGWINVEALAKHALGQVAKLADGEGISLADAEVLILSEKKKALFLSDDVALLKIAEMYGLKTWDTWNLLLEALSRNHIVLGDINFALEELGKRKFKLNPKQVQEILNAAKFIEGQRKKP